MPPTTAVGVTRTARRRLGVEAGSASLELVLLAPVLVLVLLFVVGLARMAHARQEVASVAGDAARAASLQRNTADAAAGDARTAADRVLSQAGITCRHLHVSVDLADYQPGGSVSTTVRCTVDLSDVTITGLPGTKTFTSTAVVPIETYRAS